MGGSYELDSGEYHPLALLWKFEGDTLHLREKDNKWSKQSFRITPDSLFLKDQAFPEQFFSITNDHLQWNPIYPRHFHRLGKTKNVTLNEVNALLTKSNWLSNTEELYFSTDSFFLELPKGGTSYYKYCYKTYAVDDYIFLYKYGNHSSCRDNFQFIEQVISITSKELRVLRWEEGDFREVVYNSLPRQAFNRPSDFQLCNKYLYINYPPHRYYYKGTVYNGGLYHINKIVSASYRAPENSAESGLIRMRFIVNCEGKAGKFEMLELDNDYKKKEFDPAISSQIFEITERLQDWKPGRDEHGQPIDTYRLLTFRINNGKIIDIFP
ncbi:hypothetical protein C900_04739 [Fulvivirga imtechensis AK7]|uniref:Uncharacterized protein n=2 Tax=Fulvivirga TaxID=396811 RepID=L8JYI7_9BACT|nr:hypothetical protein C900_04739 [Fulvivirga imtechensis AK7]